jgi:hypothetical protein
MVNIHSGGCRREESRWIRRICARINQQIPSDFTHSEDSVCGEVSSPKVSKDGVNHGHPKPEESCQ